MLGRLISSTARIESSLRMHKILRQYLDLIQELLTTDNRMVVLQQKQEAQKMKPLNCNSHIFDAITDLSIHFSSLITFQ